MTSVPGDCISYVRRFTSLNVCYHASVFLSHLKVKSIALSVNRSLTKGDKRSKRELTKVEYKFRF